MGRDRKKIQAIPVAAMADIAFLLLTFFLVATTMNVDTGLHRLLPPLPAPNQKTENVRIKERNLLRVFVNRYDRVMVNREAIDVAQLKDKARDFILNRDDDPALPEMEEVQIDLIGLWPVSRGVISLQSDRGTSYDMYIMVQNELTRAFNEIRDEVSMEKFGRKFTELAVRQRNAIQKAVPMKVSEAEPRNTTGR